MKIKFLNPFRKDFKAIRNASLRNRVINATHSVLKATTLRDIPNVTKMEGCANAYRIRIGDYRIGMLLEGDLVIFAVFDHRSNIYSRFP